MPGFPELQFLELDYGDPAAEAFFDATQEVLGTLGRLDLTLVNATTLRALAGPGADAAGMGVGGALRVVTAAVDRAMPGAAVAGRFDVWVTTGATTIAPGSPPSDTTNYSWDLAIVAQGGAAPATAYAKRVGYLDWNGAAITRLVQTFGRRDDAPHAAVAPTGDVTPLEGFQPAGATAPALRLQVGNVEAFRVGSDGVAAHKATALSGAGKTAVQLTAADAGLTIGGDVNLYRGQADVLRTDDNLWAGFNVAAQVGAVAQTTIGGVGAGGAAGILMNDAALSRAAAGHIDSTATLNAPGFMVGGAALAAVHLADGAALARLAAPTFTGLVTLASLQHGGPNLGFYGVAPVARPAARTLTNWTAAANARRAIDRQTFTMGQLFDFVMTLADDLRTLGLVA